MKSMEHVTVVSVLVRTETDIGIVQVIRMTTSQMPLGTEMMNTSQHRVLRLNQTGDVIVTKTGYGDFFYSYQQFKTFIL